MSESLREVREINGRKVVVLIQRFLHIIDTTTMNKMEKKWEET